MTGSAPTTTCRRRRICIRMGGQAVTACTRVLPAYQCLDDNRPFDLQRLRFKCHGLNVNADVISTFDSHRAVGGPCEASAAADGVRRQGKRCLAVGEPKKKKRCFLNQTTAFRAGKVSVINYSLHNSEIKMSFNSLWACFARTLNHHFRQRQ